MPFIQTLRGFATFSSTPTISFSINSTRKNPTWKVVKTTPFPYTCYGDPFATEVPLCCEAATRKLTFSNASVQRIWKISSPFLILFINFLSFSPLLNISPFMAWSFPEMYIILMCKHISDSNISRNRKSSLVNERRNIFGGWTRFP